MSKQIVTELRELHQNVGGAIEIIDILVEERSEKLLAEWANSLFKMAIEVELRASNLARRNLGEVYHANAEGTEAEAVHQPEENND